jgi:hypothetical protein
MLRACDSSGEGGRVKLPQLSCIKGGESRQCYLPDVSERSSIYARDVHNKKSVESSFCQLLLAQFFLHLFGLASRKFVRFSYVEEVYFLNLVSLLSNKA